MVRYRWNIAEAKASLSELVREAAGAPQRLENRGREVAVVLSVDEYQRLVEQAETGSAGARMRSFLQASAEVRAAGGVELELPLREPRASPFEDEKPRGRREKT
ncbi:type II toxin-antitoxin system Phd/YefM family antitoxin [Pendulispora rubella]|uniref:Antitoxin n=1 Tax=Pendulispora rubella TaxID=2741070 RepID=A0ABZ2LA27_9BACT